MPKCYKSPSAFECPPSAQVPKCTLSAQVPECPSRALKVLKGTLPGIYINMERKTFLRNAF